MATTRDYKNVSGSRKEWCRGWSNRTSAFNRGVKRHTEKVFRATERVDVEEGLADFEDEELEVDIELLDYEDWLYEIEYDYLYGDWDEEPLDIAV
jgi:hypothetical protein